jgi:hypothetical protein
VTYSPAQLGYAKTIIAAGDRHGATAADKETAIMVALAESDLQNYANSKVPESLKINHDAIGSDGYSVGLFQQQVGIWGDAQTLMNPDASANLFYDALAKVPGRATMPLHMVAQSVQRSAFPDGSNYAARKTDAESIMAAIGGGTATAPSADKATGGGGNWLAQHGGWQRVGLFALGIAILIIAALYLLGNDSTVRAAVKAVTL